MERTHEDIGSTSITGMHRLVVLVIAVLVFIASYGVLHTFGLSPNSDVEAQAVEAQAQLGEVEAGNAKVPSEYPQAISIPSRDLEVTVANPTTADPSALDSALLKGAVRYPTSGLLGTDGGNVVIFAHSSYLPVVHNLAYKAFDGIQHMKTGEKIYVTGKDRIYVYAVDGVYKASTTGGNIPLSVEGNKLTLITCDSFATKSDRYVVTAKLVESYLSTTKKS